MEEDGAMTIKIYDRKRVYILPDREAFYKDIVNLVYTNLLEDVEDKFNNCSNAYWACKEHELRLISNC